MKPNQAGVVPYRRRDGIVEICLVTSTTSGNWVFPKGNIDPGMSPEEAALQEAFEEAGLTGQLEGHPVGGYNYVKRDRQYTVLVFLMRVDKVDEQWIEEDVRSRRWFPAAEAREELGMDSLKQLLDWALERLVTA